MKKAFALATLGLLVMSSNALAGEYRGGDAALGALSGAVVFGPIGALAGALVGYSAGPDIAHSWGLRRSHASRRVRKAAGADTRAAVTTSQQPMQRAQASTPPPAQPSPAAASAATQPQAPAAAATSAAPPVQTLE
jgi:hypothetical protein